MPVGATVVRGFELDSDNTVSNLHLSAPAEYAATQIPANKGLYAVRFTAQHAGSFSVDAAWTESYTDEITGARAQCSATASVTFTAARGSALVVKAPPGTVQYDNPMIWSWKCATDSDPLPAVVTLRWESDPRPLPLYSKGGNPPFAFTTHAKTFAVTSGDPCDRRQGGGVVKKLASNAKLVVLLVGDVESGTGGLLVRFQGSFRARNLQPLHLGITLSQGARTLVSTKVCAWQQTGFAVANHRGVSCWW